MPGLAVPAVAGLAAGICLLALFAVHQLQVPSSISTKDQFQTYDLTIDNNSYSMHYQFEDRVAKVVNMTAIPGGQGLRVNIEAPNATTLILYLPNSTLDALISPACSKCPPRSSDSSALTAFVDDIDTPVTWNHTRAWTVVRIPIDAGSAVVEIVGAYML